VLFDGNVVLITGGSRGIGRAVAREFAAAGATVVAQYRQDRRAAEEVIGSLGTGRHLALPADVADPGQVQGLVQSVVDQLGRIDVLVNNAGVYPPDPVLATDYATWQETWRHTVETNLIGPANLVHCVAPHMIAAGGGRIVNVTSRAAFSGDQEHLAYAASKAGLNSLSQSLAQALAPHGIYVTAVAPWFVETDMAAPYLNGPDAAAIKAQSPLGRAATPEEIARAVVFLASPGNEFTTGAIVDVNGASYLRN
jgi:3-oxoacyl-[acyl-carrier protein] reductase